MSPLNATGAAGPLHDGSMARCHLASCRWWSATAHASYADRGEGRAMPDPVVVRYRLDDGALVSFEVEPAPGFRPAGPDAVAGKLRDAVGPAVDGAKVVLDKLKEAAPDEIEVKFGVKVSGTMNWLVA